MTTVTTTVKGQVVIPAGLRKKLKIKNKAALTEFLTNTTDAAEQTSTAAKT